MRIAFIIDSFPAISETFILNQITGLIDSGHEVEILAGSRSDEGEQHEDIRKYDLMRHAHYHNDQFQNRFNRMLMFLVLFLRYFYKNPKAFFNSLNVFKYGREAFSLTYFYKVFLMTLLGKFDVILCHFGSNGNLAANLKEMGISGKVVTMFHGYDIRRGIANGGDIYQKLFERGDVILSISDYNYKHLIDFGADPERIVHHPVGIDLKKYISRHHTGRVGPGTKIKILSVSRLVKEKGLSFGIQAVSKLILERNLTNIEYQIAGDGPLRAELEQLAEHLGIRKYIRFLGIQTQEGVIALVSQADIFFLPSIAEALPVVLMEAQAAGLPVVATNVGSVAQLVDNGRTGFIVASEDVNAMAEKLEYLVKHPQEWPSMGVTGRKIVEERFDASILNKKLEQIFMNLIKS